MNKIYLSELFSLFFLFVSCIFLPTGGIGLVAGICFLVFTLNLTLKNDRKLQFGGFDVPIILYLLIAGLSVVLSPLLMPAVKGYLKILTYFCIYLVFANTLRNNRPGIYWTLGIITMCVFFESITAIFQQINGVEALATWQDSSNASPEQLMTRVYGTLEPLNPNLLGGYLIAGISSAAGLFFLSVLRGNRLLAASFAAIFVLAAVAVVFTGSRGAYIGLGIILAGIMLSCGHVIWHDFRENRWLRRLWMFLALAGIIGLATVILASPALQHRILSVFAFREDSSNAFRLNVYASSIKMFLDNWLIGIGPGNEVFRPLYGLYMRTGFDALGAYSVPLEIAVESGIFALIAFLWLVLKVFGRAIGTVLWGFDTEEKVIILTCAVSVAGIMAHGLVDTVFFRPQVQILFWAMAGIAGSGLKHSLPGSSAQES